MTDEGAKLFCVAIVKNAVDDFRTAETERRDLIGQHQLLQEMAAGRMDGTQKEQIAGELKEIERMIRDAEREQEKIEKWFKSGAADLYLLDIVHPDRVLKQLNSEKAPKYEF